MQKAQTFNPPYLKFLRSLALVFFWLFLAVVFLLYSLHNYLIIEQAPAKLANLWDFKLFYMGSLDFQAAGTLYQPNARLPFERILDKNGNTPVGSLFFLPLSLLPLQWAATIWVLVSLGLLLVGLNYIWQVYSPPRQWHWRIALLLLVYISFPVVDTIQLGSWGMIIAFLDFAAWYYARKKAEKLAGVFLGLAVAIRWQPFTIFFFFVTLRRWRLILSSLLTVFVAGVTALLVFGFNNFADFINIVFKLTGGNSQVGGAYDGSLRAFLSRVFTLIAGLGLDLQPYLLPIWLLLSLAFLALTLWRSRQLSFDYAYTLCIVAGLLLAPTSWFHYHMALLLPLAVLAPTGSDTHNSLALTLRST